MMLATPGLLLLAALSLVFPAGAPRQDDATVRERLARWDAAPEADSAAALEALVGGGPEAAARAARVALEELPEVGLAARRRRAGLVRHWGGAELVPAAAVRVDPARALEPDAAVRADLVAFLGRPDLGDEHLEARVRALGDVVEGDPDAGVRRAAIEALAGLDEDLAVARLDGLIDVLAGAERLRCAAALAALPRARHAVVERVRDGFVERARPTFRRPPTPPDVLALLLEAAYGRALAELSGGSTDAVDVAPLAAGLRHPDPGVRAAAASARGNLVQRLRQLGRVDRADAVLAGLFHRGLDDRELALQRAQLALVAGEDAAPALAAAASIARASEGSTDLHERAWAFRAALLEACARLAAGDGAAAGPALDRAAVLADGLVRERLDARSPARILAQASFVEWRGLVEVTRLLALLAGGAEPGDPGVVAAARAVHEASLRVQILTARSPDTPFTTAPAVGGLDPLLDHALSPLTLVLQNPRLPAWPRSRTIALYHDLCRALAGVAAREMPGFEPPDSAHADPLEDPERLRLLRAVREAYLQRVVEEYRERDPDDPERRILHEIYNRVMAEKLESRERELGGLRRLRYASDRALELVLLLNAEGRNAEARAIAERMLRDAEAEPDALASAASVLLLARIELAIGSAWMDQGEPAEAERVMLRALGRLDDVERDLVSRGTPAGVRTVRAMRSQVLVGLAVNANVRLRDSDKALGYFERAYELRRDDFMLVLLACYRARAGRDDEARALLRQIPVAPSNYYNLACTYALLGDPETALDFLQRELTENHFSAGSLEQQQQWARGDPDLEPLRSEPRFQELLDMSLAEARELARRAQ